MSNNAAGLVQEAMAGVLVGDAQDNPNLADVEGAIEALVLETLGDDLKDAARQAITRLWSNYIGGQFWVGGYYWSPSFTSFFREVCELELPGDVWDRARAYDATTEHACWWWPHKDFVMVCEHPKEIHRELVNPEQPRGWGSHRLHSDTGPAISWNDGWGVWSVHGVRVPKQVVEAPETLTPRQILDEPNAEVRRVMLSRFGEERFLKESGAQPKHTDEKGELYEIEIPEDEPLTMVRLKNSTPEPDGSFKYYLLRVPPTTPTATAAVAWSFNVDAGVYRPIIET